jgi:hypothetical protein
MEDDQAAENQSEESDPQDYEAASFALHNDLVSYICDDEMDIGLINSTGELVELSNSGMSSSSA